MRNYYQIKTVASAPPRRQIQAGKVICVSGLIFILGSPFIAWPLSVGVNRVPSFPLIFFGLFLDGLLIILIASKQQEALLKLRQSLLEDDPQIAASAEEFMAQRKALTQQGEITGIFIVHNATKDLYYVGQSEKAIDRAAIQFLGRGNCDMNADYKYGDSFNVRIIPLSGSGYDSLNELKRAAIQALEAAGEELY
ncbi:MULTISPECIES: hypothetical protein [unclassified Collinsella]|uniref:hypothetical protein n=1 Tax=unclassified Collinsella TaxID=2637548 RepID=UPI000E550E52|nr:MULTISPECIES: hypothetical protein [unclassified Collinsella]RGT45265.1 hypothetical protein DWX25_07270 [Collinsella sp. AF18-8LB]RGT49716.1 hypothetical protein DWX24_08040 [Collinsella sp. AF18-8]RGT66082.1 hypothetical protein DWX16_04185 [Collinsella sp. AF18-33LB]